MISDNLSQVMSRISSVCNRLGKDPKDIAVVGVTKYTTADAVKEAIESGLKHIGENRVQDALKKFSQLADVIGDTKKHLLGHLQTNKVKKAFENFDMIQSVDSIKLAGEINRLAEDKGITYPVLLQVNTSAEKQKSGVDPDELDALLDGISGMENIAVKGLMTIGPLSQDDEQTRACFRKLKELYDALKDKPYKNVSPEYLSMGMTGDYEIALEEGANMLRIGSAIFQA